MSEAYQLASEKAEKNATSEKVQYDKKAKRTSLQPGDRVLVRNVKEMGGPGKLRSYWEDKVYTIVHQKSNEITVYEVTILRVAWRRQVYCIGTCCFHVRIFLLRILL